MLVALWHGGGTRNSRVSPIPGCCTPHLLTVEELPSSSASPALEGGQVPLRSTELLSWGFLLYYSSLERARDVAIKRVC